MTTLTPADREELLQHLDTVQRMKDARRMMPPRGKKRCDLYFRCRDLAAYFEDLLFGPEARQ